MASSGWYTVRPLLLSAMVAIPLGLCTLYTSAMGATDGELALGSEGRSEISVRIPFYARVTTAPDRDGFILKMNGDPRRTRVSISSSGDSLAMGFVPLKQSGSPSSSGSVWKLAGPTVDDRIALRAPEIEESRYQLRHPSVCTVLIEPV